MKHDLGAISQGFLIAGAFVGAEPFGSGNINDTYLAEYEEGGKRARYVHQRINHAVFKDPPAVMQNVERVLGHLKAKLGAEPDAHRRVLTLVPARDGRSYHRDERGNYWRTYLHIAGGRSFDAADTPRQAFEAARAFGRFQALLSDMPEPRLHDTIPGFHDTPQRLKTLEAAVRADEARRAAEARPEIDFALERAPVARVLHDLFREGLIPERIVHNDTKLNNVIIDDATGEGLCVIDLDTVMPGLALHDFGDMVRAGAARAAEDERDLTKVEIDPALFESLVRGYLAGAGPVLTRAELEHLAISGKVIAYELGLRFLTDFLKGDTYFKTARPKHNLDRCRAQFQLVRSFERQEDTLRRII